MINEAWWPDGRGERMKDGRWRHSRVTETLFIRRFQFNLHTVPHGVKAKLVRCFGYLLNTKKKGIKHLDKCSFPSFWLSVFMELHWDHEHEAKAFLLTFVLYFSASIVPFILTDLPVLFV